MLVAKFLWSCSRIRRVVGVVLLVGRLVWCGELIARVGASRSLLPKMSKQITNCAWIWPLRCLKDPLVFLLNV